MKKIFLCLLFFPLFAQAVTPAGLLSHPNSNPMREFAYWQKNAEEQDTDLLNKASLATVDQNNHPQQRYMHIKAVTEQGFVFATHSTTPKAAHFKQNQNASLLFLWKVAKVYLQIKVNGEVEQLGAVKGEGTKSPLHENFYDYVLKPNFIQFAVIERSKEVVNHDYLNYTRQRNGTWKMERTDYKFPNTTYHPHS